MILSWNKTEFGYVAWGTEGRGTLLAKTAGRRFRRFDLVRNEPGKPGFVFAGVDGTFTALPCGDPAGTLATGKATAQVWEDYSADCVAAAQKAALPQAHPGSDPMPGDGGDDTVLEPTPIAPPEPVAPPVPPLPEARVEGDGCYCVECLRKITPEALPGFLDDGMCPACRDRGLVGVPAPTVAPAAPASPPPPVPLNGSLRSLAAGVAALAAWFVGRAVGAVAARARPALAW